jgi:hypothetical protein
MRALDADGQAIELRRVTYLPPKAGENVADETSENAAEG